MDTAALHDWYAREHRDLPWRGTRDAYAIWVSEVMLQQTRVETVIPYWHRFLERFPDVAALAAAPLDEVLKAWEGLGYYARARHLHRAAGIVARDAGGRFPDEPAVAAALPGVGRSTANAVLSIAYGATLPVLDGNARRVAVRLLDERGDPRRPEVLRRLWAAAEGWIREAPEPGMHNQAMMELGATACAPRSPRCGECPLRAGCRARAHGTAGDLPSRRPARVLPEVIAAIGLLRDEAGRMYIQKRPPDGLLGGLWEFPGGKVEPGESPEDALVRELREETGFEVRLAGKVGVIRHAYSHFRVVLHAYECRGASGEPRPPRPPGDWAWVPTQALAGYAFPRANRRILEALDGGKRTGEAPIGRVVVDRGSGQDRRKINAKPARRAPSAQQHHAKRSP